MTIIEKTRDQLNQLFEIAKDHFTHLTTAQKAGLTVGGAVSLLVSWLWYYGAFYSPKISYGKFAGCKHLFYKIYKESPYKSSYLFRDFCLSFFGLNAIKNNKDIMKNFKIWYFGFDNPDQLVNINDYRLLIGIEI